jgi:hypothetical protein
MRLLTAKGVEDEGRRGFGKKSSFANERIFRAEALEMGRTAAFELSVIVLIVGPKLFIEPGAKAFFQLSSVSDPGL